MTAIDWQSKPEPWRSIGREFAEEVAAIVGATILAPILAPQQRGAHRVKNPDVQRLAEARAAAGMSRRILAELTCISASAIHDIEKGIYNAAPDRRDRLAAALGVPVSDIWS